ncbi:MAG: OmpA family protein [Novosphingobium sp.]|nr:OmpA family protein [Novosphingobium sp.]
MNNARITASLLLLASLAACQQRNEGQANDVPASDAAIPDALASAAPDEPTQEPKKSIIREDVDIGPSEAPSLEPVHLVVPYPAKGAKPDDTGRGLIDGLLANPTLQAGGQITIWGHSDSRGSDAENLAASRRRAEAARDYLASKGIDAKRMTVIALGEARPIAPNRNLDGSDDSEGRAKNRRVEIEVAAPNPSTADRAPENKGR